MPKFTDSQGREWTITVNVATTRRLKADHGFDFHSLMEDRFSKYIALMDDNDDFVSLLWHLLKPQAEAAKLDEAYFLEMAPEDLDKARAAWEEAFIFFIPNKQTRSHLKDLSSKVREVNEAVTAAVAKKQQDVERILLERLEKELSPEMLNRLMDEKLTPLLKLSETSTDSPAG